MVFLEYNVGVLGCGVVGRLHMSLDFRSHKPQTRAAASGGKVHGARQTPQACAVAGLQIAPRTTVLAIHEARLARPEKKRPTSERMLLFCVGKRPCLW
jgi:hypothetical protein